MCTITLASCHWHSLVCTCRQHKPTSSVFDVAYDVLLFAGLPSHGLLVLMPIDMLLSVASSRPPTSHTLALSATILPLNLSPAAVACLMTTVNCMKAAASEPHGPNLRTPSHPSSVHSSIEGGVLTDEEGEQQPKGGQAPQAACDDLQCGMFSMAPVLASRPGLPRTSHGRCQCISSDKFATVLYYRE